MYEYYINSLYNNWVVSVHTWFCSYYTLDCFVLFKITWQQAFGWRRRRLKRDKCYSFSRQMTRQWTPTKYYSFGLSVTLQSIDSNWPVNFHYLYSTDCCYIFWLWFSKKTKIKINKMGLKSVIFLAVAGPLLMYGLLMSHVVYQVH